MFGHMKDFIQQVREELHIMRLELMETKQDRVLKKTKKKTSQVFRYSFHILFLIILNPNA